MNLKRFVWASAAVVTISWCGIASAAYSISTGSYSRPNLPGSAGFTLAGDGSSNTSNGGPFQFVRSDGGSSPSIWNYNGGVSLGGNALANNFTTGTTVNKSFTAFCIDLGQNLAAADSYTIHNAATAPTPFSGVSPLAPMGTLAALRLGVLWYNHVHGAASDGISTAVGRAATQLAIWETVYDTQILSGVLSLTTGNLQSPFSGGPLTDTDNQIRTLANSYLTELNAVSLSYAGPIANVFAMSDTTPYGAQDQLVELGPGFADVPEPATVVAWGLFGAIGLVVARRRKR